MADLIELVVNHAKNPQDEGLLRQAVAAHAGELRASAGRSKREWVYAAERSVRSDPAAAFSFDAAGVATLRATDHVRSAGRFEAPSIRELRGRCERLRRASSTPPRLRLFVFDGASAVTDIGSLQATSGEATLFQVASQFNCLESTAPYVADVWDYFGDNTQGPRASISAFPATLLRHYAAPGPNCVRFVQQTDGRQIDLLADAIGPGASRNGYLTGEDVPDPKLLIAALEDRFEDLCVGVHDAVQVALGYDWDGGVSEGSARIAQVFTSTVAGGGYGGERALGSEAFTAVCRQLLRAAYLGTLLATISLGRRRVVLTLIGGGVFGNPARLILDSIPWALDQTVPILDGDLDVVLNGFNLGRMVDVQADVVPLVRNRGGALVQDSWTCCADGPYGKNGVNKISTSGSSRGAITPPRSLQAFCL